MTTQPSSSSHLFPITASWRRPPWEPPPLVAYRLNGQDIPLERGGPVRMVVPWAHGFKSIKWLQRIVLTNDYQANDTYALQNNDPESYLKTAAYIGKGPISFRAGEPIAIDGTAMVGPSGLKRVEFWVRPATGADEKLADDDPAWKTAVWSPCELMPPPDDWDAILPAGTSPKDVWGFDRNYRQAQGLAVALQHGSLDRPDERPRARNPRAPRPHGGLERLRSARTASLSEVGIERRTGPNFRRDDVTGPRAQFSSAPRVNECKPASERPQTRSGGGRHDLGVPTVKVSAESVVDGPHQRGDRR